VGFRILGYNVCWIGFGAAARAVAAAIAPVHVVPLVVPDVEDKHIPPPKACLTPASPDAVIISPEEAAPGIVLPFWA
jgi:hypothetical protein